MGFILIAIGLHCGPACAEPPTSAQTACEQPLVGVNYFAGWWKELPNKWHGQGWNADQPDWRPERVHLQAEATPGLEKSELLAGARVVRGREATAIAIPRQLLGAPTLAPATPVEQEATWSAELREVWNSRQVAESPISRVEAVDSAG